MDDSSGANQASDNSRLDKLGEELEQIEKKAQGQVIDQPIQQNSNNTQNPPNLYKPEFQKVESEDASKIPMPQNTTQSVDVPQIETPELPKTSESVLPPPPASSEPPSEQEQPKTKKSNPLIWVGIAVLLVILLAVGGYVLFNSGAISNPLPGPTPIAELSNIPSSTPVATPDPTADWKTYTGKAYSFKYPNKYILDASVFDTGITLSDEAGEFLTITPLEFPQYQNFFECSETKTEGCIKTINDNTDSIQDILVDDRRSKSFFVSGSGLESDKHQVEVLEVPKTISFSSVGFFAYIGDLELDRKSAIEKDDVFKQILSTFKFVESEEDTLGVKVSCEDPRPEVCTQEYLEAPPYICGSDGRQYGNTCMACGNSAVDYYTTQNEACSSK